MPITNYRTLSRSGLVVSPLALGTMTFGTARWSLDEAGSAAVFNAYLDLFSSPERQAASANSPHVNSQMQGTSFTRPC